MKKDTKDIKEFTKISELKSRISEIVDSINTHKKSEELIFNRGFGFKKFKITIDVIEEDFMVDPSGTKWMRVKD